MSLTVRIGVNSDDCGTLQVKLRIDLSFFLSRLQGYHHSIHVVLGLVAEVLIDFGLGDPPVSTLHGSLVHISLSAHGSEDSPPS